MNLHKSLYDICFLWLHMMPLLLSGQSGPSSTEFSLLLSWFEGEFTNQSQVAQEKADGVSEDLIHDHIYSIFKKVEIPQLGNHVFFVKQYMDGDTSKIYRQRLYSFEQDEEAGAVRLSIWAFLTSDIEQQFKNADNHPEMLFSLARTSLRPTSGCEVYWKRNQLEYFDGTMKHKSCNFISSRSGKRIFIDDNLRLYKDAIWINDQATDEEGNYVFGHKGNIPHKLQRVTK